MHFNEKPKIKILTKLEVPLGHSPVSDVNRVTLLVGILRKLSKQLYVYTLTCLNVQLIETTITPFLTHLNEKPTIMLMHLT